MKEIHPPSPTGPAVEKQAPNNFAPPSQGVAMAGQRRILAQQLSAEQGHPLNLLSRENEALLARIEEARQALKKILEATELEEAARAEEGRQALAPLAEIQIHYAKKGDLLYPLLATRYGVSGPSEVLWTEDDEIRDGLSALRRRKRWEEKHCLEALDLLSLAQDMVGKEARMLFPICALYFSAEEWDQIYWDSLDYRVCFGQEQLWALAEERRAREQEQSTARNGLDEGQGRIHLPGGSLSLEQLQASFATLPVEITVVDEQDRNCYFNEGPKIFKRPLMALGRDVYSCHPPRIEAMVRSIIADLRSGRKDSVDIWMEKEGRPFLVRYMALRKPEGHYLGVMEVVQDMSMAQKHFQNTSD